MLKKDLKIAKDYFSMVNFKNKYLIGFIICNLLTVLISLIIPVCTSEIVNYLSISDFSMVCISIITLAGLYLLHNLFLYGDCWCYAQFFKSTYVSIHKKMIDSIYNYDEKTFKIVSQGKIINTSNMDIVAIAELPSFIFEKIIHIIKLAIIFIVFARKNIFLAIYALAVNFLYVYYSKKCNECNVFYEMKQRQYADKLTGLLRETLAGLKDIKTFNLAKKIDSKFNNLRKKWQINYFLKRKYYFTKKAIVVFITQYGKILLYLSLTIMFAKNKISLSTFLLLISYYESSKSSIESIMDESQEILNESVSMYRIKDIIDCQKTMRFEGTLNEDKISGKIEFKDVSFKYDKLATVYDVSFTALPHEVTAIVGKTGAGKTTLFNLLLRLYKVERGQILIDNANIYEYTEEVYNSNVAVVNQNTFIFDMSIRENLSLIDTNINRQCDACKRVGIHDFIMSLPSGYNTKLKENATNISGGQKQLLSLARALLTKSEIILLDEVTSSLDPKTTNQIIKLLNDLKLDHTVLLITHNKELMKKSDKLIVLKNGSVVGIGPHKNLIRNNKEYKDLFYN